MNLPGGAHVLRLGLKGGIQSITRKRRASECPRGRVSLPMGVGELGPAAVPEDMAIKFWSVHQRVV